MTLGSRIKKTPVVVGNCTGFTVNRVFFPYTMAAVMLVDAGDACREQRTAHRVLFRPISDAENLTGLA